MKFAAFVLLLGSAVISTSSANMLNVTVYYESLCPDSIAFITKQLAPSYESFKPFINLTLVPYGLAKLNESVEPAKFECRHGERECDGDKVHACLLANDSITMESKLKFINCTMSIAKKDDTEYPVKQCANTLPSPAVADELMNCATSTGTAWMQKNKEKTEAVHPAISKVPVIVLNEKYNDTESEQARTAFKSLLCKYVGQNADVCAKSGAAGTAVFGLSLSLMTMIVVYANI